MEQILEESRVNLLDWVWRLRRQGRIVDAEIRDWGKCLMGKRWRDCWLLGCGVNMHIGLVSKRQSGF